MTLQDHRQRSRILVVEDDGDLASAMRDALDLAGYAVTVARDGDEAMSFCERWVPDAIVLDHNLPVMTGEQFLHELRWNGALCRVPVLLISALMELPSIAQRLHLGFWLTKPIAFDALVGTVHRMIVARSTPPPAPSQVAR